MLHPQIRILTLLVFIAATATARPAILLCATVLLALAYPATGSHNPAVLWRMIVRLRWLFVAILLVYGWWTPGEALVPAAGSFSPVREGLQIGLLRVAVLVLIVCAVNLLVSTTQRGQLLAALYVLTRPFLTHARRERLAVRLLLTLEAVPGVQGMLADNQRQQAAAGSRLQRLAGSVNRIYSDILDTASRSAGTTIEFDEPATPPWYQWLLPLILALAAILLDTYWPSR
jgi:energy-coupling factor transporter transmembrane protein EcfT